MSSRAYVIDGIGICMDKIKDRIDNRKMIEYLMQEISEAREELEVLLLDEDSIRNFNVDDYLYGQPYDYLAEIFASLDDTEWLTYDSAEGTEYLYFCPMYPWQTDDVCPRSMAEVHQLLISVVSQLTDMTAEEIEEVIDDDLYDWYYG